MDIGHRVREVREDLGMQRTVLARRVGVAENTIYRIETGKRTPSLELLESIAHELRTEPAELLREPVPLAEAPRGAGLADADPSSKLIHAKVLEEIAELWAEQLARGFYDRRTLGQMHMAGGFLAMNHEAEVRDVRENLPPHFLDQLEAAEDRFIDVGTQIWEAIEEADRGQAAPPDELAARREAKSEELRQQLRGGGQARHA